MDDKYTKLASVPQDALREIKYGALKGKSDINPQWRYEALTDIFGLCGVGWKYEIVDTHTEPVTATGELMVFVQVNLYIKDGEWSEPIPGFGGDFLIIKDKNGIHGNDEAFKMATTDALGTAAKLIGVAADVYRGKCDSKYSRGSVPNTSNYAPNQEQKSTAPQTVSDYYQLVTAYARKNKAVGYIVAILKDSFNKTKFSELSLTEAKTFYDHMEELIKKQHELSAKDDAALMDGVG